jgi:DNA-binding Lrp family transcriptional regulator
MVNLVCELLKDSSKSDRDLAKILKISQPTVSRLKKEIVQDGIIKNFTIIPDFFEIGYRIKAFTFVKIKHKFASENEKKKEFEKTRAWMLAKPNVIYCDYCRGMGMDGFMISYHKSYNEFNEFLNDHNSAQGDMIEDVQNILINISKEQAIKPLNLKYLANDL